MTQKSNSQARTINEQKRANRRHKSLISQISEIKKSNEPDKELIPIKIIDGEMLVDGRLLHLKLQSGQEYAAWIKKRIKECQFEEGKDFWFDKIIKSKTRGGNRRSIDYLLTLDSAKELAMLERNKIGHFIRRYFIDVEKRYRDWVGIKLPQLKTDRDLFTDRDGYDYEELLLSVGCSTKPAAMRSRINRNRQEFWKSINGNWFVSEDFGKTIIMYSIARRWSADAKKRHLSYEDQKEKGGAL